jgi:hypothetical protein
VRLYVARITVEDALDARLRVVELSGKCQQRRGFQLGVVVVREKVGRSHVLAERIRAVAERRIRLGDSVARLAEPIIKGNGVAILDDRFLILLLLEELVAAFQIALLIGFGILAPCRCSQHERRSQKKTSHVHSICPSSNSLALRAPASDGFVDLSDGLNQSWEISY